MREDIESRHPLMKSFVFVSESLSSGAMNDEQVRRFLDGIDFSTPILLRDDSDQYHPYDTWTTPAGMIISLNDRRLLELCGERIFSARCDEPNGVRSNSNFGNGRGFAYEAIRRCTDTDTIRKALEYAKTQADEDGRDLTSRFGIAHNTERDNLPISILASRECNKDTAYIREVLGIWHDFTISRLMNTWHGWGRDKKTMEKEAEEVFRWTLSRAADNEKWGRGVSPDYIRIVADYGVVVDGRIMAECIVREPGNGADCYRFLIDGIKNGDLKPLSVISLGGGARDDVISITTAEELRESLGESRSNILSRSRDALREFVKDGWTKDEKTDSLMRFSTTSSLMRFSEACRFFESEFDDAEFGKTAGLLHSLAHLGDEGLTTEDFAHLFEPAVVGTMPRQHFCRFIRHHLSLALDEGHDLSFSEKTINDFTLSMTDFKKEELQDVIGAVFFLCEHTPDPAGNRNRIWDGILPIAFPSPPARSQAENDVLTETRRLTVIRESVRLMPENKKGGLSRPSL